MHNKLSYGTMRFYAQQIKLWNYQVYMHNKLSYGTIMFYAQQTSCGTYQL